MENIEDKIYSLMRKSASMRDIYYKYPNLKNEDLLKELESQWEIEKKIIEIPILKDALIGFSKYFNMKPSEILDRIEYKSDIEIRSEFEKMKREENISSGKKEFGTDKGGFFKFGTPDDKGGSDFSVDPNSFNI